MTGSIDLDTARQAAADLFAAAARRDDIPTASRLACLEAEQSLACHGRPLTGDADRVATDELITSALRTLGELSPDDFDDPAIAAAARHGRQALR